MGNWWDVITSPIQQAITNVQTQASNVQQAVSNVISPQPTSQPSSGGSGAGYTSVLINPATNQAASTPVQIYSSGGAAYTPSIQSISNQVASGIQSLPSAISFGIQNLPSTIGSGVAGANQALLNITGMGAQGLPQTPQGIPQGLPTPFLSQAPSGYTPSIINPSSLGNFGMNAGMTLNVPFGDQAETQVKNINAVIYDPVSGGWSGYTTPYGHSISNIVTGGGAGSLQSGKFTVGENNALTPVLYTQSGTYKGELVPGANAMAAAMVLSNPEA